MSETHLLAVDVDSHTGDDGLAVATEQQSVN